eukprot:4254182-Pyramimonas_sp.AAC.1
MANFGANDSSEEPSLQRFPYLSYSHEPQPRGEMPQSREPAREAGERGDGAAGADEATASGLGEEQGYEE